MSTNGDGGTDTRRLAAMARAAVDLGSGELKGPVADRARRRAEQQLGMRCGGCGARIGMGFEFTRIDVVAQEGRPTVDVQRLSACDGSDGCEFAGKARGSADSVRMIEHVWLSGDAPVGGALGERVEGAGSDD